MCQAKVNTSVRDTTTLCHNYIKLCHNMVVSLAQFTISLPLELDGWTRIRAVFFTLESYAEYVLGTTPSDEPRSQRWCRILERAMLCGPWASLD